MKSRLSTFLRLGALLALLVISSAHAAEPPISAKDLPHVAPVEPAAAIGTFQLRKGLKLELAACEPQVTSPVAICFDERGRMFVVEMRDYPDRRDERLGRVRLLEDTHGTGVYDRATIYADGLPWPTGIICYDGGVFVAASPDIIYLKDTRHNGVADVKKTVFTGFAAGSPRLNVQGLLNSFNWGLDNRIHGATSSSGGAVTCPETPLVPPINLRGRDFSFDPRTLDLRAESGGGQYGLSFNTAGRKFVCSNSHHLQAITWDARYAGRNPLYAMPSPLADIAADGPAAEVYRTSPDEAWRVIRTKWRVSGQVPGLIEGGGRPSGYFTGATGIAIYRGSALPPEFLDNAFIGDAGSNLLHRKLIHPDGASFAATRPNDEQHTEFLTSRDIWFRPVQLTNGPDGALYIVDMYREVIEHPWSLPDSIKALVDLHSGTDRGRIYRVVPEGFQRPASPRLDLAKTPDLVALLEHPNGWHRDTAARLLYERQDQTAQPLLDALLRRSASPLGRLHALHALAGLNAPAQSHVLMALGDPDASVRAHGLLLAEPMLHNAKETSEVWSAFSALAHDASAPVRFQLALTLGESANPHKVPLLESIATSSESDPLITAAVLNSLAGHESESFGRLCRHDRLTQTPGGRAFLKQLAALVGARGVEAEINKALGALTDAKAESMGLTFSLAAGLVQNMSHGAIPATVEDQLSILLKSAAHFAADGKATPDDRTAAVTLLGAARSTDAAPLLLSLMAAREPQSVQSAALSASAQLDNPEMAREWLKRLPVLSPQLKSEAIALLLRRPARAMVLLRAIESGTVRADALLNSQSVALLSSRDPQVSALAKKVLPKKTTTARSEVIQAMLPALELTGRAQPGNLIYRQRCISCHRSGGEGSAVGPDFVTVKGAGKEKNLVNILDPNREVAPSYISYLVETRGGDTLVGLIVGESTASVTVRQAFGTQTTILRADVKRLESQNVSLMPEGLEAGLSTQDLADLLEYIATVGESDRVTR